MLSDYKLPPKGRTTNIHARLLVFNNWRKQTRRATNAGSQEDLRDGGLVRVQPRGWQRLDRTESTARRRRRTWRNRSDKSSVCWQCKGLHEFAGQGHNGRELVQIEVAPGVDVSPETLFDARLKIVREAGFPENKTRKMHDAFFEGLTRREELTDR